MSDGRVRAAWRGLRPRLRTVLLVVSLTVLLLPLGGVFVLRLYESVLVRRAQAELLAQGAVVAAAFREEILRETAGATATLGRRLSPALLRPPAGKGGPDGESLRPTEATLDLALDPVLEPPPPPFPARSPAAPALVAAGLRLTPILVETQRLTLAGLRAVDHAGTVVASSRGELGLSLARRQEVVGAIHGESVSLLRRRDSDEPPPPLGSLSRSTRVRVYVALPVVAGERVLGAVVLSRTPRSLAQSLYGIRGYLLSGVLVFLIAVTLLALFVSGMVNRPVRELIRRTERVARGERGVAVALERPGTHEVEQLSLAFARMAATLEQRADAIRALASSVSHEFKTPLAAMRGAVELLREHGEAMSPSERERFLANLDGDVGRLGRLVDGLVELARADVVERSALASTDVAAALERVAARTAERFPGRRPALRLEPPPPGTRAAVAADALEAIAANLVDNALRHGGEGVQVTLAARPALRPGGDGGGSGGASGAPGVELAVGDDGPGITPANQARVFEPFFTTARGAGGTGLGLAIVRTLAGALGGEVRLASRPGETVFRVWLPGA